jgi:hypothetical protein
VVVLQENWTLCRFDTERSGKAESVPAFVEKAPIIVDNPWRQEQGPFNTELFDLHV